MTPSIAVPEPNTVSCYLLFRISRIASPQSLPSQQGVRERERESIAQKLKETPGLGAWAFPAHQRGRMYYPKPVEKHADGGAQAAHERAKLR